MGQIVKQVHIFILESDHQLAQQIQNYFGDKAASVTPPSTVNEALDTLKSQKIHLAFLGNPPGGGSCFDLLKDFVKSSPMTYVVLITDGTEKDVYVPYC